MACAPAEIAVIASSTSAGVFVMTRTTGVPVGQPLGEERRSAGRRRARSTSLSAGTFGPRSASSAAASCGLTAIASTSASATAVSVVDDPDAVPGGQLLGRAPAGARWPAAGRPASPRAAARRAAARRSCRRRSPRRCACRHLARRAPRLRRDRDSAAEEDLGLGVPLERHGLQLAGAPRPAAPGRCRCRAAPPSCPSRPRARRRSRCRPNRVASTRSNAVGVPPRWMCPSTTVRASLPVVGLELLGQPLADAAEPDVAERVQLLVVQHHLAVERLGALGDHDDRRVLVLEALLDVRRRPGRRRTAAPAAGSRWRRRRGRRAGRSSRRAGP